MQKYVESIFCKKSGRVQKVIQGWRRRKGSNEERNEKKVKCWGWVFHSLSNEEWTRSSLLKGQEGQDEKGHFRVPFTWNFLGNEELPTYNSEPLKKHQ